MLKLLFCLACALSMLACTPNKVTQTEFGEEIGYEQRLEDLRTRLEQMRKINDPKEFMPLYKEIEPFLENNADTSRTATSFRSSVIQKLLDIGVYGQAIKQSYRALEANGLLETDDSILTNLMIYGKLLYAYDKTNSVDTLLYICEVAIDDAKKHTNKFWLSSALNNAGQYFYQYGRKQAAYSYLRRADSILNVLGKGGDRDAFRFQGNVQNTIATIYADEGKYEKALDIYSFNFFQRYTKGAKPVENQRLIDNGISLAKMQTTLGRFGQAEETLAITRILMETLTYTDKILSEIDFTQVKKSYYEGIGDFQNGYYESKKIMNLKDSLAQSEGRLKTQTMNLLANFSSGQMEDALEQERKSRQAYEQRVRLQMWVLGFVVIAAVALVFGLVRFQKQRLKLLRTDKLLTDEKLKREEQQKKLLSLRLENKKKDLTDMALSLHQKQQWAKELDNQIKVVKSERGYKRSRELKKLQVEIRRNVYVDNKLKLIQQNMDVLSHTFFNKLKDEFPTLTKSENKLCSFIKLGLTNAQIAQLQNVAPSSVRISRYRLKKKLKLGRSQNLDAFIQEF